MWGAAADSVYTRPVRMPSILTNYISTPHEELSRQGLTLVGWSELCIVDSAIADSGLARPAVAQPDTSMPMVLLSSTEARMVLSRGGNLLTIKHNEIERWSEVDPSDSSISFYEAHDGTDLKTPSTARLAWYIPNHLSAELRTLVSKKLTAHLDQTTAGAAQRGRNLEVFRGAIAGQQVSLSVTGNVVISGGIAFKDQSKSVTNFRANKNWELEVDQTQRFDITGNIGDRIEVLVHQDSENDFEWENDMKIAYKGREDEILQSINAGNISLSLPGTKLAGGTSAGLFGLKSVSKMGPMKLTSVASIERSKKSSKSNTLGQDYSVSDLNYMANRYFFLDRLFRSRYYPLTDKGEHIAYNDHVIGELAVFRSAPPGSDTYPGTAHIDPGNPEYMEKYKEETSFERLEQDTDYSFDQQLGYIRLAMPASDRDIIAVAYTVGTTSGQPGDSVTVAEVVGDLYYSYGDSTDIQLKLIKAHGQKAEDPTWPLEFKNVYFLGATQISPEGFSVRIIDRDSNTGNSDRFTNGWTFLRIFGLDRWDKSGNPNPDDEIDIHPSVVKLSLGELHFPSLLPFVYVRD
ncbi:MAG: hypothetical protein KAU50_09250, partial [Candidatus Marinimicrobia bacterium]|nr:hypothetical protein [Candidatus Neomarinimicrobiota bacterium]